MKTARVEKSEAHQVYNVCRFTKAQSAISHASSLGRIRWEQFIQWLMARIVVLQCSSHARRHCIVLLPLSRTGCRNGYALGAFGVLVVATAQGHVRTPITFRIASDWLNQGDGQRSWYAKDAISVT